VIAQNPVNPKISQILILTVIANYTHGN